MMEETMQRMIYWTLYGLQMRINNLGQWLTKFAEGPMAHFTDRFTPPEMEEEFNRWPTVGDPAGELHL